MRIAHLTCGALVALGLLGTPGPAVASPAPASTCIRRVNILGVDLDFPDPQCLNDLQNHLRNLADRIDTSARETTTTLTAVTSTIPAQVSATRTDLVNRVSDVERTIATGGSNLAQGLAALNLAGFQPLSDAPFNLAVTRDVRDWAFAAKNIFFANTSTIGAILDACPNGFTSTQHTAVIAEIETFLTGNLGLTRSQLDQMGILPPSDPTSLNMLWYVKLRLQWPLDLLIESIPEAMLTAPEHAVLTAAKFAADRLVLCLERDADLGDNADASAFRALIENEFLACRSRLDDKARFTDDAERDAQTASLTAELQANQAKLDAILARLDDPTRFTSDAERGAATAGLGNALAVNAAQLDAATARLDDSTRFTSDGELAGHVATILDTVTANQTAGFDAQLRREIRVNLGHNQCTSWMYTPAYLDPARTVALGGHLEDVLAVVQGVIERARLLASVKDKDLDAALCRLDRATALAQVTVPLDAEGICGLVLEAYDLATVKPQGKGKDCKKQGLTAEDEDDHTAGAEGS